MKYPNEFTMQATSDGDISYTFTYDEESGKYITEYAGRCLYYTQEALMGWKFHTMVPKGSSCNGVDAEGNPFHFTQDMLKPFMRCISREGVTYINCPIGDEVVLVGESNWLDSWIEPPSVDGVEIYDVMAVYGAPSPHDRINPNELGALIWQRVEQPVNVGKPSKEFQQRLDYYQTHIDAVQENVESLKAELEKLKQEAKQ